MKRKSPQRTRRIRAGLFIGGLVGFFLGLAAFYMANNVFFIPLFIVIGAVMAGTTTAFTTTDYDMD